MSKAKLYFQTDLLQSVRLVVQEAVRDNVFPPVGEDNHEHLRMTFLKKMVVALECKDSVEKLVKECTIFFAQEQTYNAKPFIFQLYNCIVDLETNTFRLGRPSDLTSRRSTIVVPEKWLKNPGNIEKEAEPMRQLAWKICWSVFSREGEQHRLDHAEVLGDQDEINFQYFLKLLARLLEGKPLAKCVLMHSPRGRNSKGLVAMMLQSTWGEYLVPVKASVFYADKRSENEHSAAELVRVGARIGFGNETSTILGCLKRAFCFTTRFVFLLFLTTLY